MDDSVFYIRSVLETGRVLLLLYDKYGRIGRDAGNPIPKQVTDSDAKIATRIEDLDQGLVQKDY